MNIKNWLIVITLAVIFIITVNTAIRTNLRNAEYSTQLIKTAQEGGMLEYKNQVMLQCAKEGKTLNFNMIDSLYMKNAYKLN